VGFWIAVFWRYDRRMNHLRWENLAPTVGWSDLIDEFDCWKEAGRVATLWWRDDDAAGPSTQLDRLLSISGEIPISLAVIPAEADAGLGAWLAHPSRSHRTTRLAVLQHGWRHKSHAFNGKKSEFPPERCRRAVASDLAAGRIRLAALFGVRALPVLVPPWNRFDCSFLPLLSACGLGAISSVRPRRTAWPEPGIIAANVHVDLVAWAGSRGFIGERAALAGLIGHLRARRLAEVDAEEPTGILTHHLIQDEATDAFLRRLAGNTDAHRAACWLDATEVFADPVCSRL
jgi:hypothetical protein